MISKCQSGTGANERRRAQACTRCRRAKMKCDASARFPKKCSRCERLKQHCELGQSTGIAASSIAGEGQSSTLTKWPGLPESTIYCGIPFDFAKDERFGHFEVTREMQLEAYKFYVLNNHAIFPAIPSQLIYRNSPLLTSKRHILYWTMVLVGLSSALDLTTGERSAQAAVLYHVQVLISQGHDRDYLRNPYDTLSYVLALTLMGYWHPGARRLQDDSAWVYSGMAYQLGCMVGLHTEPSTSNEFGSLVEPEIRTHVWRALAVSNQLMAMSFGLPPLIRSQQQNPHDAGSEMDLQSKLLVEYHRFTDTVDTREIIRVTIDHLCQRTADILDTSRDPSPFTHLLALYVKSLAWSTLLNGHDNSSSSPPHEPCILPLYAIAVQTIDKLDELGAHIAQSTYPTWVFRHIVTTCILIYRLIATEQSVLEERAALNAISRLYSHCRHASNAEWALLFLDSIHVVYTQGGLTAKLSQMTKRFGASIVIDTATLVMSWRRDYDPTYAADVAAESQRAANGHETFVESPGEQAPIVDDEVSN